VVIAIIGILSAIILASLSSAEMKARDSKRIQDLGQMRTAIELYYTYNGSYPNCPWVWSPINDSVDATWNTTGCLITALKPYMSTLPVDPKNNAQNPWVTGNYSYRYGARADLQDYGLIAQLEDVTNNNRCAVQQWVAHAGAGPWCGSNSPYLYSDH
jgi:type II secretory pathway pseudopilin PulG